MAGVTRLWTKERQELVRRAAAVAKDDVEAAAMVTEWLRKDPDSRVRGMTVTRAAYGRIRTRMEIPNAFERDAKAARAARQGAPVAELDFDDDADTVQRDSAAPQPAPETHDTDPPETSVEPGDEPEDPVEARERRDENASLRSQVDDLVRRLQEANQRHAFLESAAQYREPPRIYSREKTSGIRELTPIVLASDWHVEERVLPESIAFRNEYNLDIAAARIERFFRHIIWHIEHHRASGKVSIRDMLLWLGGDLYSGYIHEENVETGAFAPPLAVRWLLPRIRDGIATLLEVLKLEKLLIVCSHGNHGRTTHKMRFSTGYANSFDWLLYHSLADEFRHDKRVTFEITASNHQYAVVYGQTIHFHHGNEVRYQGGVGGLGIPLLKRVPVWDRIRPAALHCMGHWHQLRDYGRAIVNGSLIGYNAFAQGIGIDVEDPFQALFYIDSQEVGQQMVTKLRVSERVEAQAA